MRAGVATAAVMGAAFLRTRALHRWLTSRQRIERWQASRLERLRLHAISQTAYYRRLGDVPFTSFPVVDKAEVMQAFGDFNTLALSAADAWHRLESGHAPAGYDIGCSTGTSGNRGLYLVSDRERFLWLGTILAKAVPDAFVRRHRVAVILPRTSRLYDSANESRLLTLRFFDLNHGLETIADHLTSYRPTIVVAPPKALRWLAQQAVPISPEHCFTSAEVLDAPDRAVIERTYAVRLGQIYMATEGLFAVSCRHGTLHLAEDAVHFELEPVRNGSSLVTPIVTDLQRRAQVMARYRMNDLLRLSSEPCPCGSALQAVDEIVGRRDDCFELAARASSVTITPDVLRNAVLGAHTSIDDFRLRQTGDNTIELVLSPRLADEIAEAARCAVIACCTSLGTCPNVTMRREELPIDTRSKLRRVEQQWRKAV